MAGQGTKIKKKKKSVLKRAAQSIQRADVNRANRTRVRTLMKRLRTAVSAGTPPPREICCNPRSLP